MSIDDVSPISAFVGDESGEIFTAPSAPPPEAALPPANPINIEHQVITQSGFLVVIKRINAQLSLSFKRRIGTPPTSSILFTPDESTALSKFLTETELSEPWQNQSDLRVFDSTSRTKQRLSKQAIIFLTAVIGSLLLLSTIWLASNYSDKSRLAASEDMTDKFVRTYVSNMLDFSPRTYRYSQIQAMAAMTPDLMQKYWHETHFPISLDQLKSGLKRDTFIITQVVQGKQTSPQAVDVYAQLNNPTTGKSTPVHLQLQLFTATNGQIKVQAQKDISAPGK